MSALRVERNWGGVDITGLLAQDGVLEALIEACKDGDRLEYLTQGAAAAKALESASDPQEKALAQAALDEARDWLAAELADRRVRLDQDAAIGLRRELQRARLGEGRADDWQARRRVA